MTASAPLYRDEEALVEGLRRGENDAYDFVVRQQMGRMLSVARRYLRNEEEARDAVQEAFVSMFRSLHSFKQGAQLSTWLHRIVVNAALMRLRSKKSRPETSIEELLPSWLEDGHHAEPPDRWSDAQDVGMERQETRAMVRAAIDALPETYRTVLMLRDIEELSTEETAQALGITANAVKVRLHRAHQALRTLLDRGFKEPRR